MVTTQLSLHLCPDAAPVAIHQPAVTQLRINNPKRAICRHCRNDLIWNGNAWTLNIQHIVEDPW